MAEALQKIMVLILFWILLPLMVEALAAHILEIAVVMVGLAAVEPGRSPHLHRQAVLLH